MGVLWGREGCGWVALVLLGRWGVSLPEDWTAVREGAVLSIFI